MRFFNTEGPVRPENHYHIPPLTRIDLDELLLLVRRLKYFVLHAPRQTGKTSTLLALRDLLNGAAGGDYRCVYVNVEGAQAMRENVELAMRTILSELASRARSALGDAFLGEIWPAILAESGPGGALRQSLTRWAEADPRPLVLLIDEIDTLVGDTLLAVLRQLRAGHDLRPGSFPQSVILCGVRDVRDYRIHSTAERSVIGGGSAFNIKAESLRLGDFSREEVRSLLAQHTGETGQAFSPGALETIWTQSQGQPWLVNALAYETCFRDKAGRDRTRPITADAVLQAREQLVRRRETHLDQLTDKLQEERVRRVIEPLLAGAQPEAFRTDDLEYVRDLGLVRQGRPLAVANPIYREVIPRDLTWTTQETFPHDPAWCVAPDGRLLSDRLLAEFQTFFREHSEHWVERFQYKEAGPQLLLQAFLQRIVNSGGRIEREYGLGRMRVDLLIVWPVRGDGEGWTTPAAGAAVDRAAIRRSGAGDRGSPAAHGESPHIQKVVIECKVLYGSLSRTIAEGLAQTRAYMDRCEAEEGHLVVFDRTVGRSWEEKVFRREETTGTMRVTVWGL